MSHYPTPQPREPEEDWSDPIPGDPYPSDLDDWQILSEWRQHHFACGHQAPGRKEAYYRQLCRPCWRAALRHLSPEQWETLHRSAACLPRSTPPPTLPKLSRVHPRKESVERYRTRIRKVFCPDPKAVADYALQQRMVGKTGGDHWFVTATNGAVAVLEHDPTRDDGPGPPVPFLAQLIKRPAFFLDLPPEAHLGIRQLLACASRGRTAVVHATVLAAGTTGCVLQLQYRGYDEVQEATVTIPATTAVVPLDRWPTATAMFDGKILEALCGLWPLRWYWPEDADNTAHRFSPLPLLDEVLVAAMPRCG